MNKIHFSSFEQTVWNKLFESKDHNIDNATVKSEDLFLCFLAPPRYGTTTILKEIAKYMYKNGYSVTYGTTSKRLLDSVKEYPGCKHIHGFTDNPNTQRGIGTDIIIFDNSSFETIVSLICILPLGNLYIALPNQFTCSVAARLPSYLGNVARHIIFTMSVTSDQNSDQLIFDDSINVSNLVDCKTVLYDDGQEFTISKYRLRSITYFKFGDAAIEDKDTLFLCRSPDPEIVPVPQIHIESIVCIPLEVTFLSRDELYEIVLSVMIKH